MKIAIAGGGTGGHIFPGIAVARELQKEIGDVSVLFIGTSEGIEATVIPREGFEIKFIRSEGLVGRSVYESTRSVVKLPLSVNDSWRILKQFNPDVVLGVGGYCSGPVLFSAFLMKKPTIIHEQNTVPGLTNKMLGKLVNLVAVTYYESLHFFPKNKTFLTGNPVREEILEGDRKRGYRIFGLDEGLFTIFVFGGSSGAHKINKALSESLVYLKDFRDHVQFLHQTGEKDFDFVREFYHAQGFRGTVIPFTHDMGDAYAVADLVISRAGATTLAELTACGKPAILIPYPFAAGDHQRANAEKLWDLGAAQMILDHELNGMSLSQMIKQIFEHPDIMAEMEKVSKTIGKSDAGKRIVELIMRLGKAKGLSGQGARSSTNRA
ncbi:undecaprenyldiphospho-muramoylpentapeptide beta-N-acetylglucosaminyltransferase [bacterium]|nr:MAG: undecaprenyldiphospho-muramoylpentapeptide beta-N-acetylglucosaminyltransferase [bacterium]